MREATEFSQHSAGGVTCIVQLRSTPYQSFVLSCRRLKGSFTEKRLRREVLWIMASHKSTVAFAFLLVFLVLTWCFYRNDWTCPSAQHLAGDVRALSSSSEVSIDDIFRYFHWTNADSCRFSVDFGFWIYSGGGVSAPDGHKAVCLDLGVAPVYKNCLVYSFGINNQWAFDDAMSEFGCQVHSFDPSMGVQDHDRGERIHFHNLGLSGKDGPEHRNGGEWSMKTLTSVYNSLLPVHGSVPIDVLKMDIEFAEWQAIPPMIEAGFLQAHVKQMAVEIHFNKDDPVDTFRMYYRVLKMLEESGFVRFSSRPNPWLKRDIPSLGRSDYIGLELAWYNKRFSV